MLLVSDISSMDLIKVHIGWQYINFISSYIVIESKTFGKNFVLRGLLKYD